VPTTDDDVRAQLTSAQQTLDRLFANSSSAVGTSGSAGAGTIAVDRAILTQLREQVSAALAALNRR